MAPEKSGAFFYLKRRFFVFFLLFLFPIRFPSFKTTISYFVFFFDFLSIFFSSKDVHFSVSIPLNVFFDLQDDVINVNMRKKRICFVNLSMSQQN